MWIHRRLRSALAFAAPLLFTREQPQEHSHDKYLNKVHEMLYIDNTINARDPIFGLLVDNGAKESNATISDLSCLQMAIADVAYTNSKKTSDLDGMVASLIYRTLERNTNGVGVKSALCTSMRAVNPEIAALEQQQDPASSGAAAHNRAVVLELARQISLIGGNATIATDASTFAPGSISDFSGKGNSCDQPNCIYANGLLQVLVTNDEITTYVNQCVATLTVTVTQTGLTQTAATHTVPPVSNVASIPTSTRATPTSPPTPSIPTPPSSRSSSNTNPNTLTTRSTNLQTFNGALGAIPAPSVTVSGSRYAIEGPSDTHPSLAEALRRSCDTQHSQCADIANSSKQLQFTVGQCDLQNIQCHAAISS